MRDSRIKLWIFWLLLALAAACGLPRMRVSNSLEAWMPDLATPGPYKMYVVVGFPTAAVDPSRVTSALRALPSVRLCIDPTLVRWTTPLTGTTPQNFVLSSDGQYAGVFCFAREGVGSHALLAAVREALAKIAPPHTFAIGGPAAFEVAMDEWGQARLPLILFAILIAGGAMLWAITGSLAIAGQSIGAIVLAETIFMGGLCWLDIPIDMSVALVPPLMTGLGFSYAAHRVLRRRSLAILATCGLAAMFGLASYGTADLKPVRHFALAGIPGLLIVWMICITLLRHNHAARRRHVPWLWTLRNVAIGIANRRRSAVVAIAVIATVSGIRLAPRLKIQSNPLSFFPPSSDIFRDFATLNDRLTGMLPSEVIVNGQADALPLMEQTPGVRKVVNVTLWQPGQGRTYLILADNSAADRLAEAVPRWQAWAQDRGTTITWYGVAAQIHRSGASIRALTAQAVPSMAALVLIMVWVLFRQLRVALLAAWTAFVPVAALASIAALFRWELDPVTLVIGSITTGLAVDDLLQLLYTTRRRQSVKRACIECWRPCVGSSLAAAVCFALFTLSPMGPTAQFGLMMTIATVLAMLSNQLLVPVVARWQFRRIVRPS